MRVLPLCASRCQQDTMPRPATSHACPGAPPMQCARLLIAQLTTAQLDSLDGAAAEAEHSIQRAAQVGRPPPPPPPCYQDV